MTTFASTSDWGFGFDPLKPTRFSDLKTGEKFFFTGAYKAYGKGGIKIASALYRIFALSIFPWSYAPADATVERAS